MDTNKAFIDRISELEKQRAQLLEALKDLRKELRAAVRFDVKKHYSLMVADVQADKAIIAAEQAALAVATGHDHERLSGTLEIETTHGHTVRVTNETAPHLFTQWEVWSGKQQQGIAMTEDWQDVLFAANMHLGTRSDIAVRDYAGDVRAV